MAWKTEGKIGCHFPERSGLQVNFDVSRIVFNDDGVEGNSKEIEKVYYIPPGVTVTSANIDDYLVWKRYWVDPRKLVAGTQTVCIEYVPEDEDVVLSSIAIYTHDSVSTQNLNIGIIHESGLVIFSTTADQVDTASSPKYDLEGERRYVASISGVTLKKGLKYYIQYTSNDNNTFKPAYFQDSSGQGNYLDWHHGDLQTKSVANLNSAGAYLGVVSTALTWLAANENDFMICGGINGLNTSNGYIRNGVLNGASTIGVNGENLPVAEKDKLLALANGVGFMYIGNNYTESGVNVMINTYLYARDTSTLDNTKYAGIKTTAKGVLDDLRQNDYCIYNGDQIGQIMSAGRIYRKKANLIVNDEIDFSDYSSDTKKLQALVEKSYNATANKWVGTNGILWQDRTGNVYRLKSGWTFDWGPNGAGYGANDRPTTANTIYLLTEGCAARGSGWLNPGIIAYDGTNDAFIGTDGYGTLDTTYFDLVTLADAIEEITSIASAITAVGDITALTKTEYSGSYISNTIRGQTVSSDKKFYLEINGREV